jgi:hypothetical protein
VEGDAAAAVARREVHAEVHPHPRARAHEDEMLRPAHVPQLEPHRPEEAIVGVEHRPLPDRTVRQLVRAAHVVLPLQLVADVRDVIEDDLGRVVEVERVLCLGHVAYSLWWSGRFKRADRGAGRGSGRRHA